MYSDLLDAPDDDLLDEGGEKLTDHGAEQTLVGILLQHPQVALEVRAMVDPRLFHDRALGRVFEELAGMDGFTPDNDQILAWLGGETIEVAGRTGIELIGYLRSLGMTTPAEAAGALADRIAEVGERRIYGEGPVVLPGESLFQSKMGLLTWADRNSFAADNYPFLVEDLIPELELVMVIGATQAGKSFLAFHMAMCIARGVPFFGKRILEARPVVWCAFEGGRGARARMLGYDKFHKLEGSEFPFAALTHPLDLWSDEKNVDELIKEIKGVCRSEFAGKNPGAIFVDTYNAATPGASEIDSEVVSKIRGRLRRLARELQCSIIIIGHTNSSGKARGNEQLPNNADTVITVAKKIDATNKSNPIQIRDNDGREVRTVELWKQREGATGHLFDFVLPAVQTGLVDGFGKPRTTCVATEPNWTAAEKGAGGRTQIKNGARFGTVQTAVFNAFWDALQEYGEPAPPSLQLPRETRTVKIDLMTRVWNSRQLPEDDYEKTKAQRARAIKIFQNKNIIKVDKDTKMIWWTGKFVREFEQTHSRQRSNFDDADERRMLPHDEFPADD